MIARRVYALSGWADLAEAPVIRMFTFHTIGRSSRKYRDYRAALDFVTIGCGGGFQMSPVEALTGNAFTCCNGAAM